jgi:hypothetical protein
VREVMEVTEGAESGPASIGNNDVEATEGANGLFDETNVVSCNTGILIKLVRNEERRENTSYGLDYCSLDSILLGADLGDLVCPILAGHIVHNDIGTLFRKFLAE